MRILPGINRQLGLQMYQGQHGQAWNYMMAGSTIAILPGLIILILVQKYLVEGISLCVSDHARKDLGWIEFI